MSEEGGVVGWVQCEGGVRLGHYKKSAMVEHTLMVSGASDGGPGVTSFNNFVLFSRKKGAREIG